MVNFDERIKTTFEKYFDAYDVQDINNLLQFAMTKKFAKNEALFPNEHQDDIFILLSGWIRSYYIDFDGNDITHVFFDQKSFFRVEKLFIPTDLPLYYEALTPVTTVFINREIVYRFLRSKPCYESAYIKALEAGMQYKIVREQSLLLMNATERYQQFLIQYEHLEGRIQQNHIASYIGITPESLSRIKRNLKKEK